MASPQCFLWELKLDIECAMLRVESVAFLSEEYQRCVDIRKIVFVEEQNVPVELEIEHEETSIHFLGSLSTAETNLAVCTGRLRPLAASTTNSKEVLKFERIATLKNYRGQGLGAQLMKALQEHAALHFPNHEWLMGAQVSALSFYEKLGWKKKSNETFLDAGIEHYLLTL